MRHRVKLCEKNVHEFYPLSTPGYRKFKMLKWGTWEGFEPVPKKKKESLCETANCDAPQNPITLTTRTRG